jgi:hypothetical protein
MDHRRVKTIRVLGSLKAKFETTATDPHEIASHIELNQDAVLENPTVVPGG